MICRLIILSMFLPTLVFGEPIYKWVDEEGNLHFSDQPPPREFESEELILSSRSNESETRKSQDKLIRLQARLKRDQERRSAAREAKQLQKESDEALRVSKLKRCLDARYQLHDLETQVPVYYINERGERVYLNDDTRAEYIEFYYAEIDSYCD